MLVLLYNLKLFLLIHTHNTQDLSMLCVFKELPCNPSGQDIIIFYYLSIAFSARSPQMNGGW